MVYVGSYVKLPKSDWEQEENPSNWCDLAKKLKIVDEFNFIPYQNVLMLLNCILIYYFITFLYLLIPFPYYYIFTFLNLSYLFPYYS